MIILDRIRLIVCENKKKNSEISLFFFLSQKYYKLGMTLFLKRALDILFSFIGFIILSPVFLIVAILIKIDSEGPVFVKLKRISQGKGFNFIKFRSMINNAHSLNPQMRLIRNDRPNAGPFWKMKDDPRITRIGKFLRSHFLDELPSLFNVLKGDISLVGPRPHEPGEVALYKNDYPEVVAAKAGITCLPRLYNPHLTFEQEMALEREYLKNQSLWLDFKILVKTLLKVLKDRPEG